MREFPLDIVITEGNTYTTPRRMGLLIHAIGTDSTTDAYLEVEGMATGKIKQGIAPLHKIGTNLLGPLSLKDLAYVIPPETDFRVVGASGCKMRLIGKCIFLAPGEDFPSDLIARYNRQKDHYYTYVEGSLTMDTDEALAADEEKTVLTVKPSTIERYVLNGPLMVDVENYSPSEGELAVRFRYDETYLDKILENTKVGGIDIMACPRPPTTSDEMVPFSLEAIPITVEPGHALYGIIRNIKGSAISPATGTALKFTITAICTFERIE